MPPEFTRDAAPAVTRLIVGNWKMNGVSASIGEVRRLNELLEGKGRPRCTIVICPPATLLAQLTETAAPLGIVTGGQDCHTAARGAHTGEISAEMLADAGAQYVILGHSERRADRGETSEIVRAKAQAALAAGLVPIICLGERAEHRESGTAEEYVTRQLAASVPDNLGQGVVIAYEPRWAIGTGITPSLEDIESMHATLRRLLTERFGEQGAATPILYGGSAKPGNARDILGLHNVDGGLIGGASLLANDFHAIISAV